MTYLVKAVRPLGTSAFACSTPQRALSQVIYFERAGRRCITVTAPDGTPLTREALIARVKAEPVIEAVGTRSAA